MLTQQQQYQKKVMPEMNPVSDKKSGIFADLPKARQITNGMKKKFGYKNDLAVPRIVKVVVNSAFNTSVDQQKREAIEKQLTMIVGQKPAPCKARKSISSFKLRQGAVIGYKATLRGKRMYDFLEKMLAIAFPRTRDFRGINPKAIDSANNLTIGFSEHIVFPEMIGEEVRHLFGLEATIVTNAKTREEAFELLKLIGVPFKE